MKSLIRPLTISIALVACSSLSTADTLEDTYQLALKNDATLKASEATYKANLETEKQGLSQLLPQINASGDYSESDIDNSSNNPASLTPNDYNSKTKQTTVSASLSQTLFDLSAWFTFKSGKETSKQAEAQFAYDQQDLIVRTITAYFNVLRALDNLEAAKAEERATKRQLEQTQQRFDVGLIAITDVHEAQASYDNTVVQRLTDEGDVGTSYESLAVITGQHQANLWLLSKDFPVVNTDPQSRDEWVQFALKNNYSLKASLYGMEAARQNATSKKMEHAPTLSGSYAYNDNGQDIDVSYQDTDGSTWGVTLTVPIYSGGYVSSQRRQAYEQYNYALQTKINTQRTVVSTTRASHIIVTTDVQAVKARQQGIVSSNSALEATQAGYEVGTRNIVDVLNSQRNLYDSIRDYANARYDYILHMVSLKQAAGLLSPQDVLDINKWLVAPDDPAANQYKKFLNNEFRSQQR